MNIELLKHDISTKAFNWDDTYVLNPDLGIRPDNGRALMFNRNPVEIRRGHITTERAIIIALLDGTRNLR